MRASPTTRSPARTGTSTSPSWSRKRGSAASSMLLMSRSWATPRSCRSSRRRWLPGSRRRHPLRRAGVLQVVHQEDHPRHLAVGARVLPQHAVLVPVQARTAGRLADDDGLPELDIREPHAVQLVEGGGVADQVGQLRIAVRVDQRPRRSGARQALFVLGGDGAFGAGAGVLDQRGGRHVGDDAETLLLQLQETLRADGIGRSQRRRNVGRGHARMLVSVAGLRQRGALRAVRQCHKAHKATRPQSLDIARAGCDAALRWHRLLSRSLRNTVPP